MKVKQAVLVGELIKLLTDYQREAHSQNVRRAIANAKRRKASC